VFHASAYRICRRLPMQMIFQVFFRYARYTYRYTSPVDILGWNIFRCLPLAIKGRVHASYVSRRIRP